MNEIEWDNEKSIVELITQLSELLSEGYKTVELKTYESGNGTCEDGSPEFQFTDVKIVANR